MVFPNASQAVGAAFAAGALQPSQGSLAEAVGPVEAEAADAVGQDVRLAP